MTWTFLNGLLAFAVTMIVMSTVIAAIVETIHEIRRKRERYMRAYLLSFFDTHILPNFWQQIANMAAPVLEQPAAATGLKGQWAGVKNAYSNMSGGFAVVVILLIALISGSVVQSVSKAQAPSLVIASLIAVALLYFWDRGRREVVLKAKLKFETLPFIAGLTEDEKEKIDAIRQAFVNDIAKISNSEGQGTAYATRLKPTEFAAALGRSDLGQMLAEAGRDKLDLMITDLLRRFDNSGAASVTEFQKQSRTLSIFAAFAVAIVFNVNAITVLSAYFSDDKLSARVIALYDEDKLKEMSAALQVVNQRAYEDLTEAQKALQEANEKIADKSKTPEDAEQNKEAIAELQATVKRLVEEINTTMASLSSVGVPIGWQHYPYCTGANHLDALNCEGMKRFSHFLETAGKSGPCQKLNETWFKASGDICSHIVAGGHWLGSRKEGLGFWIFGVLLAGVLIGLGGPFWFDFYRRLSAVTQIARSLGLGGAKPDPDTPPAPPPNAQTTAPTDPQKAHAPQSAVDAFKEAVEARAFRHGNADVPQQPDGASAAATG